MMEINKTTVGIAVGVLGTLFLGYCIYFDKKRRSDPEYKKKVRERRAQSKSNAAQIKSEIPNLNDHEAIEKYFIREIQLGESQIATGDFENGVEHLANAIVVCGQPTRLLQILQTSLPAAVFAMLVLKMQEIGNRAATEDKIPKLVATSTASDMSGPSATSSGGTEDNIDELE